MLTPWAVPFERLLAEHGLSGLPEREFPTDGWSGARFSTIERGRDRFVIKRTSLAGDWIAAATDDVSIREAWVAATWALHRGWGIWPYLGAGADDDEAAILMPDLSVELIAWDRPHQGPALPSADLDRVLGAMANLHKVPWPVLVEEPGPFRWMPRRERLLLTVAAGAKLHRVPWPVLVEEPGPFPWTPLPERLLLTSRPMCARHIASGIPAGIESATRLLAGWDAFDRKASRLARSLVADLSADVTPLVRALSRLPNVGLHGDLKLANVAIGPKERVWFIDWSMTIRAPVAVELGWFLVSNSGSLSQAPDLVLDRYRSALFETSFGEPGRPESLPDERAPDIVGDWDAQVGLAMIVGLLLRGFRKGLDTEAGVTLASGIGAADDLAWWCERAVEASARLS